jgi:hypothetical protein
MEEWAYDLPHLDYDRAARSLSRHDVDDSSAEAQLVHADSLLHIATIADAEAYVTRTLDAATNDQRIRIFRALLGVRTKQVARQLKASRKNGGVQDAHDRRLYDVLQLADSLHDFGISLGEDAVREAVPAELPVGLTLQALVDETKFIKFLTSSKRGRLDFANDASTTNPLCGANVLDRFDVVHRISRGTSFEKLYASHVSSVSSKLAMPHVRAVPVDVWTRLDAPTTESLKLEQIATVCRVLEQRFGDTSHEFIVDSSDPHLVRIVFAIRCVRDSLFRKFRIEDVFDAPALVRKMRELAPATTRWSSHVCDANLMDGASHPVEIPVDTRPTGYVYRAGLPFQMRLLGAKDAGSSYEYEFASGATVCRETERADAHAFSTSAVTRAIKDARRMKRVDDIPGLLAQKRACDWAQVENCRRYGRVFATCDRLAALYAIYRGVRVVLFRRRVVEARRVGWECDFVQYTFATVV